MSIERLSTGVAGLDEILQGGFIPGRAYLVRGGPGVGKTILGLHFLTGGEEDDQGLFITFGEPAEQIQANAEIQGFDCRSLVFLDLSPDSTFFSEVQTYDIFSPAEVEREPTTRKLTEQIQALQPRRVFLDAMTQFRYLAGDAFQFRKQALSFLRFLTEQGATVLFSSEGSQAEPDDDLKFMSDGVIELSHEGADRHVTVTKFRGSAFRGARHTLRLTAGGMQVFPRLQPELHSRPFESEIISSGVPELDELLHGGIERGLVTILTGPSGVGKTTIGLQFMKEAAGRGERSVVYCFEEEREILLRRCESINIPVRQMIARGTLSIVQVEPLAMVADEFAEMVRREVQANSTSIVMLDSTSGYRLSLRGEDLSSSLNALCRYLRNVGATTLLINEVETIVGDFRATEAGLSYMADNVIFLRYLELNGGLRKAIGVLKKRLSNFEHTLRELEVTRYGIKVGKPLTGLRGILSGVPEFAAPDRSNGAERS